MSNALSIFKREDLSVAATADAIALRDSALSVAALISQVVDDTSNAKACEAMRALKQVQTATEKARKDVKAPFLEACQQIDATAKEFVGEVVSELNRLSSASADWQTEQTRRMRDIQRKRDEENARLEKERLDELARIAAANAAGAITPEAAVVAAEKVNELATQEKLTLPPEPVRPRAEGQVVREEWDFEVVNPFDLVRAHPGCVKIEVRRSEVDALIQAKLRSGENPPKIAGLRVFLQTKVSVRQPRGGKVVDL